MPYKSSSDLPDTVKNILPAHAQAIYKEAFNSSYETYKHKADRHGNDDRETVAHKVAWSAVKQKYHKDADGTWHSNETAA